MNFQGPADMSYLWIDRENIVNEAFVPRAQRRAAPATTWKTKKSSSLIPNLELMKYAIMGSSGFARFGVSKYGLEQLPNILH